MKKLLVIVLTLVLTLSLATAAMAQIETKITGEMSAGYLTYPGWDGSRFGNFADADFSKGTFFGQYRWFNCRFTKEVAPTDQVTAGVIFQLEYTDGDYGRKDSTQDITFVDDNGDSVTITVNNPKFASPVQNFYLIYDPGFMKLTFDAKGREVKMGITDEELLVLNIARRYAKDGEPHIYRCDNELAKQLTAEVPLGDLGKAVVVLGLEQLADGTPVEFAGAYGQFFVGPGSIGIGYQPEMTDSSYKHTVSDGYFVIATDFDITDNIRLQADYSSRNDGDNGYNAYWRAGWMETYSGTVFLINHHINSKITINGVHNIAARIMSVTKQYGPDAGESGHFKYQLDGSYSLDPYRIGVNYRNWAYRGIDDHDGMELGWGDAHAKAFDSSVVEIYGIYEAGPEIKVFYRTDGAFGAIVKVGFW